MACASLVIFNDCTTPDVSSTAVLKLFEGKSTITFSHVIFKDYITAYWPDTEDVSVDKTGSSNKSLSFLYDATLENTLQALSELIRLSTENILKMGATTKNLRVIFVGDSEPLTDDWLLKDCNLSPRAFHAAVQNIYGAIHFTQEQDCKIHVELSMVCRNSQAWKAFFLANKWAEQRRLSLTTEKSPFRVVELSINPTLQNNLAPSESLARFVTDVVSSYRPPANLELCERNDENRSLNLQRSALFVFPEGSGDGAVFVLNNYVLMINAGGRNSANAWRLASRLKKVDALLLTHWSAESVDALANVLPRLNGPVGDPRRLTCLLTPPPDKLIAPAHSAQYIPRKISDVLLTERKKRAPVYTRCVTRGSTMSDMPRPVTLYEEVGLGVLEFIPLTPTEDDSVQKRLLDCNWSLDTLSSVHCSLIPHDSNSPKVPLLSQMSASGLLLWKEGPRGRGVYKSITRILIVSPMVHQLRVLCALEAVSANCVALRHADPVKYTTTEVSGRRRSSVMTGNKSNARGPTRDEGEASGGALAQQFARLRPQPCYVDTCWLPGRGCSAYCDVEWFKRVRSSVYIVTDPVPTERLLRALIQAKETWEETDRRMETTLTLVYDNAEFVHFCHQLESSMEQLNIKTGPAAARCAVKVTAPDLSSSLSIPGLRLNL